MSNGFLRMNECYKIRIKIRDYNDLENKLLQHGSFIIRNVLQTTAKHSSSSPRPHGWPLGMSVYILLIIR